MEIIRYIMEAEKLFEINDLETLKQAFDSWCTNVKVLFIAKGYDQWLPDLEVKMHYLNNEYSDEETRKSLLAALKECISLLEYCNGPHTLLHSNEKVRLAEQILDNFKFYYRSMFRYPLHKKATLDENTLREIKIGNEYDLQRILHSVLLTVFPTARTEVNSDNGYCGMRADIYIDEPEILIETKCTRNSMSEKQLTEELGADAFHYKADTIFFFVYDKADIIHNEAALTKAFTKEGEQAGKIVKIIILKPADLY